MRGRTLSIIGAVLVVTAIGLRYQITQPEEPTGTVQYPIAEQQVASTGSDYTDSQVLGSNSNPDQPVATPETQPARANNPRVRSVAAQPKPNPVIASPVAGQASETPATPIQPVENCDLNYVPCVPMVETDLACSDIGFVVTIKGDDRHQLDTDNDGVACEEYRIIQETEEILVELPKPEILVVNY